MRINLKKLIRDLNLDRSQLSKVLFPENNHPMVALTRTISAKTSLKEEQIFRLSIFTGLPIEALYEEALYWSQKNTSDLIQFSRGEYAAIYSPQTGITKIYHLETKLASFIISPLSQPLSKYLEDINQVIINKSIKQ